MQRGRVVIESIDSSVLKDNPLGDPTLRQLAVYLPPGYDESHAKYPSIYILSGFNGRGTMLLNDTPRDENIAERMDRSIASGAVQPMVVVMPDCLTRLGGSQYINSSATGRYEDYLLNEIVPFIDRTYRTRDDRDSRAVAGKSSGGFGALTLAMRRPDIFGLTASHSGDMYFELCYKPAFIRLVREIPRFGGLSAFFHELATIRPRDPDYHSLMNTMAMAACYSPNPEAPLGFDLPFDLQTGEMNEAVWAKWLQWDPVHLVPHYATALRSLRLIYLDAGAQDEFNLQFGARILCGKLQQHGIRFSHDEFNDSHMNIPYRYDISLKAISDAIG